MATDGQEEPEQEPGRRKLEQQQDERLRLEHEQEQSLKLQRQERLKLEQQQEEKRKPQQEERLKLEQQQEEKRNRNRGTPPAGSANRQNRCREGGGNRSSNRNKTKTAARGTLKLEQQKSRNCRDRNGCNWSSTRN
jgi:hypothetical protein